MASFTPLKNVAMKISVNIADISDEAIIAKIDQFIMSKPNSGPFHRPKWAVAVEQSCGHRAYILVAQLGEEILGALCMNHVSSPLFGSAMVASAFGVDGGILANDDIVAGEIADAAWALVQKLGCLSMEFRGGIFPKDIVVRDDWVLDKDKHAGFSRPIMANEEAELLAIPRKQRAEVRKALKNNLNVKIGNDAKMVQEHYTIYAQSVRNLGTPVFPQKLFVKMADLFGDDCDILTVYHDEMPVASVLSFYHNGAVMPYWGGGIYAARGLRANDMMYFALMNHARNRGCSIFDFGRSKVDSGAYAFKKNWGFDPLPLTYATKLADIRAKRDVNPNSGKYALMVKYWKKLPMPVANFIGPFIAKGLG
ncbi:FemAB [Sphingorhabdus lutea]|uniref:FemAB n=2 Tax=Sphingorhabdus lutea TaxID=1913578 RepID=A0A1L3JEX1_9SPHN|nr:FemAB [Sphingorhabdus lutea]